ncbi:MAG: CPBP family intramembrane metalloprotease [Pirellulales bacterium]
MESHGPHGPGSEWKPCLSAWHKTLLVVACVYPTIFTWIYFVELDGLEPSTRQGVTLLGKALQFVVIPALLYGSIARREFGKPRFDRATIVEGVLTGLAISAPIVVLALGWLAPTGFFEDAIPEMRKKLSEFAVDAPERFFALGLFYALAHSGMEEWYWRWLVDRHLRDQLGPRSGPLVSSLGFAAHHVVVIGVYLGFANPWTYVASAGVGVGGWIWSWSDHRNGTIAAAWIAHALVDAALFVIGWKLLGF